jgi:hypothetical protein
VTGVLLERVTFFSQAGLGVIFTGMHYAIKLNNTITYSCALELD